MLALQHIRTMPKRRFNSSRVLQYMTVTESIQEYMKSHTECSNCHKTANQTIFSAQLCEITSGGTDIVKINKYVALHLCEECYHAFMSSPINLVSIDNVVIQQ